MSVASKKDTLIKRDSKGKIRQIDIVCEWNEKFQTYVISRKSGIYKGKFINQPNIEITKGKAKRTITEQALLQYDSSVKSYLDKGYKNITDFGFTDISQFNPNTVLPKVNTDTNGVKKPMLCKVLDKTKTQLTDKQWFASFKHDGVRAFIYNDNGILKTASRGGQDYNLPATYILNDEYIKEIFQLHPNIILDGEIYRHGWTLSKISGLCRLQSLNENHKELKFHCYDIVDEEKKFSLRLHLLNELKEHCPDNSKLVIVDHVPVKGLEQIMKEHNRAVSLGYEGLVIRDPDQPYKCDARDNRMLKIKEFVDAEFKILNIVEGLRDEDMCFLMETKEGYQFKAKPIGTREDKQWYRTHLSEIIGKMGTVKYFGMTNTDKPVPNLPSFRSIRLEKDI